MTEMAIFNDSDGNLAPSTAIVEAIAEYKGIDPLELEQPLYEVVDPDALDVLFTQSGNGKSPSVDSVNFAYDGCMVRVSGDGTIELSARTDN